MTEQPPTIRCPHGHDRAFYQGPRYTTLMQGGRVVDGYGQPIESVQPNIVTQVYTCLDCGARFEVKRLAGERT